MAYYNKFDTKNKRKGNARFTEKGAEHRYAKTNRYSEEQSSNASKPSRPAQGHSRYNRPEQTDNVVQYPFRKSGERKGPRNQEPRPSFDRKPFTQGKPIGQGRPFTRVERPVPAAPQQATLEATVERDENLLFGRNPIREALKSGRDIEKLMVTDTDMSGSAREILSMARKAGIRVQVVEKSHLDNLARNHQGMVAFASAYQYASLDDILQTAQDKDEKPFIVILDQITDPHNLGAIIRSAACTGVHGVVIPRHRAVGLTSTAVKTSSGAVEYVKVARVTNLAQTIKVLKQKGIWVYSADMEGKDYHQVDLTPGVALVIGSEGEGVSKLVQNQSDGTVSIPMTGEIGSMNASVAAGILMHAVFCARKA